MTRAAIYPALLSMTIVSVPPVCARAQNATGSDKTRQATSAVAAANQTATLQPSSPAFRNAAAVMPYAEGAIYQVYTAPERVTDIALQPGEVLGAVASGDTARWVIGDTTSGAGAAKQVHVLVKPYAAGLSTNLVITTDRRTYHLSLVSGRSVGMSSLAWTYPQDMLLAIKRSEEVAAAAAPVATGIDVDQLRFNYVVSGDTPRWRPLRAFDDGRQTFIEFPASIAVGAAPPLFLVGAKGEAQLVNYRVNGRYYVVDRIFDVAELRLGTQRQDVVRLTRIHEVRGRSRAQGRAS